MAEEPETREQDEALLRTAAEWFVRVHEDASIEDIAAWQSWMDESAAHRDAFRKIEEMWNLTRGGTPAPTSRSPNEDDHDKEGSLLAWLRERLGRMK